MKLHDIKHVEFDRIKNFRHAFRAGGGKCGVESAIMDANCRFINIVLNDNIVEQMFEYFGDGVGDTKVQIVKEETDGKVLMEIMVDSLPSDK